MGSDDEFEFELDDEEETEPAKSKSKPPRPKVAPEPSTTRKRTSKAPHKKKEEMKERPKTVKEEKKVPKKADPSVKMAKKMPLANGIKRRLAQNKREIDRLRREIREVKDDKEAFESELESLEGEFEKLKEEKDRLEEEINHKVAVANALEKKQNRTQKDFDNYKNRTNFEIERKAKMSQKKLMLGFIESLDNMDRALTDAERFSHNSDAMTILAGMESVKKTMLKALSDQGVEPVDPLGSQFDPHVHDAVDTLMDRSKNENTVVSVEAKGYIMGELVLRPAKVKVSIGGKPWPKEEKKVPSEDDKGSKEEVHSEERTERREPKRPKKEETEELENLEEEEMDELTDVPEERDEKRDEE